MTRSVLLACLVVVVGACGPGGPPVIEPVDLPPTGQPDLPPSDQPPPDSQPPPPPPSGDPLAGGVLATFRFTGTGTDGQPFDETCRVWVTNPQTIDDIFALQNGTSTANIPAGKLRLGPGQGNHNEPWSWHLDPMEIAMVEVAMEACDGRPSVVEAYLPSFLAVGSFCPWSATLDSIEDHR